VFTLAPSGKYDGSICAAAMRAVAAITVATCSVLIHKSNPIPLLAGTKGSLKIVAYLELSKLRPSLGKAPFSKKNSDVVYLFWSIHRVLITGMNLSVFRLVIFRSRSNFCS